MGILGKLFRRRPQLKVAVFYSNRCGSRKGKVLQVDELKSQRGVYVITLDNYQSIRVEVEKR
jgi:hypothetical protein